MEKLKSVIPETLKQKISESTPDDLLSTCSSLLHLFQNLPLFHQMVRDLTDPEMALCRKNKEAAFEAKANGNECFSKGDYPRALRFYSQALRIAPADVEDMKKSLIATLYVNRASSLHKLGFFLESLRDCNRALTISPTYVKAWFRRGKANASLENYRDAISDLNVSIKMETSLSGKRQIQSELSMIVDRSGEKINALEKPDDHISDELLQTKLQCISTPTKGRGMTSYNDIPQGSLIHKEDPNAAIILKQFRETYCHFCFNELPEDTVPCVSCTIPLYCSVKCQVQAGGRGFSDSVNTYGYQGHLSDDIEDYIRNVISLGSCTLNSEHIAEHRHECCGMHWPAVLPSDVVLAGRILVKYIQQQNDVVDPNFHGILDLCQNYGKLSGESKLEFHVYSIVLLCCLQQLYASKLPLNSTIASEIIILLSQIRVNSMAIVRLKFSDARQHLDYDVTSSVEQVRVAQAVYSRGSLFNHSCQPNVHAYFVSRTLFIQAMEYITAGSQLELSYGPQVGQWDCRERCEILEDRYSFICQCRCCAQLNLSDLVINAYRCTAPNCFGVVLDSCVANYENEKLKYFKGQNSMQDYMLNDDEIRKVASHVFEQTGNNIHFEPGRCLSCGSYCDLQASQKVITEAGFCVKSATWEILFHLTKSLSKSNHAEIGVAAEKENGDKRTKTDSFPFELDAIASSEIPSTVIVDASRSISTFRKMLHPFNKRIAEVEDLVAQAFCLVGDLEAAMGHCQASIEILEKLYGKNHIVIGHELIKLATIQLSLGHRSSADNTNRLVAILKRHYGRQVDVVFPHLQIIKGESSKLV